MCVGQEAVILELKRSIARVSASGAKLDVNAELMLDIKPGDKVMVHAGTIIAKIEDEDSNI